MKRLPCAVLLAALTFGSGCQTYHAALFNGGTGVLGYTVLVVPFSELRHHMWYNESTRGALVADTLKFWVTEHWETSFPDSYVEEKIIDRVMNWPDERISSEDWKEIVATYDIDYVVVGDLTEVRLKNPREVNLLSPSATARYRVIDARNGREVFTRHTEAVTGGLDQELQIPTIDFGGDPARLERSILISLSTKIAKELYGYYSEW